MTLAQAKAKLASEGSYYGSLIYTSPADDRSGDLDLGCGSATESDTYVRVRDHESESSTLTWSAIWVAKFGGRG